MDQEADRDYVEELTRWEDSGATWEVLATTARGVTVALLRCDGGEEAARFTTDDARLRAFLEARRA
ncbi:hypothetical protein [Mycolicibacterium arenosum]|uniref:Uncharacterized protein n=1 Tax=Mycolicibacterium arenosum TaxID=2952157 RepID=A0ABT1M5T6_9MYCO|nr:hypothetical protein [Mycolicibacterium sp. CAU 1645]MCP9274510.1 hypothetical protein [Mycolicibacterium sp. CAU 1645]